MLTPFDGSTFNGACFNSIQFNLDLIHDICRYTKLRYCVLYLVKSGLSVFHVRSISQSGVRQKGNEDVELSPMFSDENFLPTKRSMFILSLWKHGTLKTDSE